MNRAAIFFRRLGDWDDWEMSEVFPLNAIVIKLASVDFLLKKNLSVFGMEHWSMIRSHRVANHYAGFFSELCSRKAGHDFHVTINAVKHCVCFFKLYWISDILQRNLHFYISAKFLFSTTIKQRYIV